MRNDPIRDISTKKNDAGAAIVFRFRRLFLSQIIGGKEVLRGRFGYIECRPLFDLSPRGQATTTILPGTRLFLSYEAIHEEFNFKAPPFFGGILPWPVAQKTAMWKKRGGKNHQQPFSSR